jgi:hypothetical protein
VLSFLMNFDWLPFVEAVEDLARAHRRRGAARAVRRRRSGAGQR